MLSNEDYAAKIIAEAEEAYRKRQSECRYPGQPAHLQRFEGQQYSGQHRKPEMVKNATKCGICREPADKLENGTYVCQVSSSHMADGVVGIWSDLGRLDTAPGPVLE